MLGHFSERGPFLEIDQSLDLGSLVCWKLVHHLVEVIYVLLCEILEVFLGHIVDDILHRESYPVNHRDHSVFI